jgi:hypothetical protein
MNIQHFSATIEVNQNNHISESSIESSKEELDGPVVSALQRAIAEVKQRWSLDE